MATSTTQKVIPTNDLPTSVTDNSIRAPLVVIGVVGTLVGVLSVTIATIVVIICIRYATSSLAIEDYFANMYVHCMYMTISHVFLLYRLCRRGKVVVYDTGRKLEYPIVMSLQGMYRKVVIEVS